MAGRGESEGPDAGASKEGRAEFTLDDINAELDNLMSSGNSEVSSAKTEENATEVVNVPAEAVSEMDDGRLRDGTVVKIR